MNSTVLSGPRFDVYRAVTDKIVQAIEKGAGEFVMPWHRFGPSIGRPTNAVTGLQYRGVNIVALWGEATITGYGSGHWASYKQWQNAGAQVRKGEAGSTIVFFRELEPGDEGEARGPGEELPRRLIARASRVFNAEQVDGWKHLPPVTREPMVVLEKVDALVTATGGTVRHEGQSAFYDRRDDVIMLPPRERFTGTPTSSPLESYYATLLHELTHWSGAAHRLDREFGRKFGDSAYAMEELVADLGSAFLCADLAVTCEPRPDHAAYLQLWLTLLKQDARVIFTTARLANRASDYLHELAAASNARS